MFVNQNFIVSDE